MKNEVCTSKVSSLSPATESKGELFATLDYKTDSSKKLATEEQNEGDEKKEARYLQQGIACLVERDQ
jgi:hypothetical protein